LNEEEKWKWEFVVGSLAIQVLAVSLQL
jgi:hypothetical protein